MKFPDGRILVFAKAPIAGQVKTRLRPVLSPEASAQLHRRLIHRTLALATGAHLAPVQLWCAPSPDHPFFLDCRKKYGLTLHQQQGCDVGLRMEHALATTLTEAGQALLIGTDCPIFSRDDLATAFEQLRQGDEVVLGPAEDGGYVLIGARQVHPSLFNGIAWGTDSVLESTRQRLRNLNWRWSETRTLWDLDRPADWHRYQREIESRQ